MRTHRHTETRTHTCRVCVCVSVCQSLIFDADNFHLTNRVQNKSNFYAVCPTAEPNLSSFKTSIFRKIGILIKIRISSEKLDQNEANSRNA